MTTTPETATITKVCRVICRQLGVVLRDGRYRGWLPCCHLAWTTIRCTVTRLALPLIAAGHVFGLMAFCRKAYWAALGPRWWGFGCHMETRQSGLGLAFDGKAILDHYPWTSPTCSFNHVEQRLILRHGKISEGISVVWVFHVRSEKMRPYLPNIIHPPRGELQSTSQPS